MAVRHSARRCTRPQSKACDRSRRSPRLPMRYTTSLRYSAGMISRRLALFFGLLLFAPSAFAQQVFPPGSRIGLVPPPGMTMSRTFQGFEDRAHNALIVVTELSAQSYARLEGEFSDAQMRASGMEPVARET